MAHGCPLHAIVAPGTHSQAVREHLVEQPWDILPGMNAGASTSAVPSPIEGSDTAWVLLGSWALSPARPTPIHPRHECRGFSALLVIKSTVVMRLSSQG